MTKNEERFEYAYDSEGEVGPFCDVEATKGPQDLERDKISKAAGIYVDDESLATTETRHLLNIKESTCNFSIGIPKSENKKLTVARLKEEIIARR